MATKQRLQRYLPKDDIPLMDAFEEFIVEKEALLLTQKSIDNYAFAWKRFCSDMEIDKYYLANDIDSKVIFAWIKKLRDSGLKPVSINSYLTSIRAILYWCMDRETDHRYIKEPFKIQLVQCQDVPPKHYTDEEITALLVKPKRTACYSEWRSWAVINWILGTGNRASSVCNVRMGDIDFTRKEITIVYTKNNRALIIPLSPSLEMATNEFIRMWRRNAAPEDYLFPTITDGQLKPNHLWYCIKDYCKKRGVNKTSIHAFRHTFAIGWVRNNGNMFSLQKLLGHSNLEMTKRYVKLFAEDIKIDFELYNPLDTIKRKGSRVRKYDY